jgi:sporulation protein YlmC with PRC-barrel domain
MMLAASAIKGYAILGSDGRFGTVSDLLFDDQSWKIRWLVVDTGGWLSGRKVVIPPAAIGRADFELGELEVALTKTQIEGSPDLSANAPVSRQVEAKIYEYYGWDPYWGSRYFVPGAMATPLSSPPYFGAPLANDDGHAEPAPIDERDPHLRSIAEVTGYRLIATDGPIGHVENLYIDDRSWDIRYFIVDTRNWWPGEHVVLSPLAVRQIIWPQREIKLNVACDEVKASPPWDPQKMIDEVYEQRLRRHYKWPGDGA